MADRKKVIFTRAVLGAKGFLSRGLQAVKGSRGLSSLDADVRAIIYVAGDLAIDTERQNLTSWLRRHVHDAAVRGVLCIVAAPDEARAAWVVANIGRLSRHVQVAKRADPAALAQVCLDHDPGPFPDAALKVVVEGGEALSEELNLLIRRAFAGFETLEMSCLDGGRSAVDGVWRIDARATDRELRSPFVVKCGPIDHISEQVDTYRDVVADRVPFRGCAPLCLERSVTGATRRLSVSRFVEDAHRLDDVVIDQDVSDVISAIYSGPLRRWRATTGTATLKLIDQFIGKKARASYRRANRYTYEKLATSGFSGLQTPSEIYKRLATLPRISVPLCRSHDDLNMRNVFVSSARADVVLIDFTRAIHRPLSRDVARLDVGFGFDLELNSKQPINRDVLLDFYTGDLFAMSLRHVEWGETTRWRIRAIEILRRTILKEADVLGYDPTLEYRVAIIAELLYQAKRSNEWGRLAYRCAENLTRSLS